MRFVVNRQNLPENGKKERRMKLSAERNRHKKLEFRFWAKLFLIKNICNFHTQSDY